jgi:hypothetical protein
MLLAQGHLSRITTQRGDLVDDHAREPGAPNLIENGIHQPSDADLLRVARRRLVILVVVGALVAGLGLVILGGRSGHRPAAATLKRVPLALSCPMAHFCMAVDDQGNAIELNGPSWSAPTPLHVLGMTAVSCSSKDFCVAGTVNDSVLKFHGGTWSKQKRVDTPTAGDQDIFGVSGVTGLSCPSPLYCLAGDVRGKIATFDGMQWSHAAPLEPLALYQADTYMKAAAVVGVSCSSITFCAAATVGGRVLTWNGRTWSVPALPTPISSGTLGILELVGLPEIAGISCASSTFCVVVGPSGAVNTFDGKSWSKPEAIDTSSSQQGNHDGLTAVSCPSVRFCLAVDDLGRALSYNGTSWSQPHIVDPTLGLSDVSCATSTFCVALNDLGYALIYNGTSWSRPQNIDS